MAGSSADTETVPEEDFCAAAAALEAAGARRYRYLAAWWEARGHRALTALFDTLAAREQAQLNALQAQHPRAASLPPHPGWRLPSLGGAAWRSALKAPQLAIAFAAREEEWTCLFYTGVALRAATPAMRELAAALAGAERDHAGIVQEVRRAAFPDLPGQQRQPSADRRIAKPPGAAWRWESNPPAAPPEPLRLLPPRGPAILLAATPATRHSDDLGEWTSH